MSILAISKNDAKGREKNRDRGVMGILAISKNMKIEDLLRAKGTFEIIKTIEGNKIIWGEILTAVEGRISKRTLSFRLRELKDVDIVDVEITYVYGRPAQLYFLTEKGKRVLELIKEIEKTNMI